MNTTSMIVLQDVKAVLQSIRYSKPIPTESSFYDYLMQVGVIADGMPKQLQDYHLRAWITDSIIRRYNRFRLLYNLIPLSPDMSKKKILNCIRHDYIQSNADFEAWSVMFIYYGGLHSSISTDEHESAISMTKRTIRRRKSRGIELIYLHILLS